MEDDIIIVNSDSSELEEEDDEAVPFSQSKKTCSYYSECSSSELSDCDEADQEDDDTSGCELIKLLEGYNPPPPPPQPPQDDKPSTSAAAASKAMTNGSSSRKVRKRRKRLLPAILSHPKIRVIYNEFMAVLGVNYSESRMMRVVQRYITIMRDLQPQMAKFPKKCRALSKNVCRTLFLFRSMSKHISDTPYYYQKVSELLALYTFYELRFATEFSDSKILIAERILANISLYLEKANITYILRIFAYIPYMGKENEIVSKIFERLIQEPLVLCKHEFNDRLYIQYLIAFYHWKDAELSYEDQQKVIKFANRFMKPQKSLKSSLLYARHLPSYVKRDDATSYFLQNLVFFNDLRNASLLDGIAENTPDFIDLSDEMYCLTIDCAKIRNDMAVPKLSRIKLEERQVVATVDLTRAPDDAPWMTKLVRRAVEREVKLPRIYTTKTTNEVPVVEIIDSSDDEAWAFRKGPTDKVTENTKQKEKETVDVDPITNDSSNSASNELHIDTDVDSTATPRIFESFDLSMDLPDDSSSEEFLRQLNKKGKSHCTKIDDTQTAQPEGSATTEARTTFAGLTERELNSLPLSNANDSIAEEPSCSINAQMDEITIQPTEMPIEDVTLMDVEINRNIVANILRDFSEGSTSLSDDGLNLPKDDGFQEEQVTLTLNTNTFDSIGDNDDEIFISRYNKPPKKTYLRKRATSASGSISSCVAPERTKDNEVEKNKENVLFSGKVISLRDDNIGSATPSYLKVPDFVEVNSQGSNVVFSMQGRRLSSFPALELSSSNQHAMPDFDGDLFTDVSEVQDATATATVQEEEVENETSQIPSTPTAPPTLPTPQTPSPLPPPTPPPASEPELPARTVASIKTSLKSKDSTNSEKPTKRRSVWFAEEIAIKEIDSIDDLASPEVSPLKEQHQHEQQELPSSSSTSSLLSISSSRAIFPSAINTTINKINSFIKQFQPSTSPSTFTSTLTSTSTPTTSTDSRFNKNNTNTSETVRSMSTPWTTSTTVATDTEKSLSIAELKNQQEQELIEHLFGVLFVDGSTKPIVQTKPQLTLLKRQEHSASPASCNYSSRIVDNNTPEVAKRRRSTSSLSSKQVVSDFDRYLQYKRRNKGNSSAAKQRTDVTVKKSRKSSKTHTKAKVPMHANTKSLVDIRSDPKLSTMRPVVVIEILTEEFLTAHLLRPLQKVAKKAEEEITTKAQYANLSQMTSPIVVRPGTKSLGDFLVHVVEQNGVAASKVKDVTDGELDKIATDLEKEEDLPIQPLLAAATATSAKSVDKQQDTSFLPTVSIPVSTPIAAVPVLSVEVETPTPQLIESAKEPFNDEEKLKLESEIKPIKTEDLESEAASLTDVFKKPSRTHTSRLLVPSVRSPQYIRAIKTPPQSPIQTEVAGSSINTESLAARLEVAPTLTPVFNKSSDNTHILPPTTNEKNVDSLTVAAVSAPHDKPTETSNVVESPKKQVKVRLKRCNYNYMVVSNTALDDLHDQDPHSCQGYERLTGEIMSDEGSSSNQKRRVKRSAARKEQALKRIFERVADDKDAVPPDYNNAHRLFNGVVAGHNIDSINTPPPTPPSPSLSPALPPEDKTPANSNNSANVSGAEPNNNHMCRQIRRENGEAMLNSYISSSSDMIKEFRQHANMPTEVEIDSKFLAVFYNYLTERNDIRAKEEINKLMPVLETRLFSTTESYAPRRSVESCSLPSIAQRRTRKLSTSDVSYERLKGSHRVGKRRKTICSDSHYFSHSPDFLLDEEICSSPKAAADSPTVEVMRLHSGKRDLPPKASTLASNTNDTNDKEEATAGSVRSPQLIADSTTSSCHTNNCGTTSTPVQSCDAIETACKAPAPVPCGQANSETPTDVSSHNVVVSRTYSKCNMVQHVFVPPEIEKCIEEQASTGTRHVEATSNALPSTSFSTKTTTANISSFVASTQRQGSSSGNTTRKIRQFATNISYSENSADDANDSDYTQTKKVKRRKKNSASSSSSSSSVRRKTNRKNK